MCDFNFLRRKVDQRKKKEVCQNDGFSCVRRDFHTNIFCTFSSSSFSKECHGVCVCVHKTLQHATEDLICVIMSQDVPVDQETRNVMRKEM